MEPLEFQTLTTPPPKRKLLDRFFAKLHALHVGDGFLLKGALLATFAFLLLFIAQQSMQSTVQVATSGGTFSEGVIGTPRFINPVLAVTRADKDLSALVYDGLLGLSPNGVLTPNIAETVTVSEDGLTYNVILKKDVKFHDGSTLTARDVVFTIERIQDPLLASPLRANFDGVTVEEVGEHELNFILPEAYSLFTENLTFGILPEHIWKDAGTEEFPFSQHNSEPVGSGPYVVERIVRNSSGIPEMYILRAHTEYHAGTPKIDIVQLHFFPTEEKLAEAFNKGLVESVVGISAESVALLNLNPGAHHLERIPLPRTFALFINQNKSPALRDLAARNALNAIVDREALVDAVLAGYGNALTTPIPTGFGITPTTTTTPDTNLDVARDILKNGGWKLNPETQIWEKEIDGTLTPLTFSIATVNNSAFEATATFLQSTWKNLGVEVTIKQFEQVDLTQAIIRPRDYETLLFGTHLGRSLDYYSFWHSSQRNDPGLNIALYANITTDSILAEMRRNSTSEERALGINRFVEELTKETPAIFLYAPELLYVFPNRVGGASFTGVSEPQERFARVHDWYVETESVWPFFTQ